jgi:hypothetical protein
MVCVGLAILWAPPLIEQMTVPQGNISLMAHALFEQSSEAPVGWVRGAAMAGTELLPWGPWLGWEQLAFLDEVAPAPMWQLGLCFVPLAIAGGLAWRFRDGVTLRLVALVLVAMVTCIAANAHIRGVAYAYLTFWSRPIAMLGAIAPGIGLTRILLQRRTCLLRCGVNSALIVVGIVTSTVSVRAMSADVPIPIWSRIYEMMVPPFWVRRACDI